MREETGESVLINSKDAVLEGALRLPDEAEGIVIFACASRQRRPQTDFLANVLPQNSLATLLVDLLTPAEDALYEDRLNMELLTERLASMACWAKAQPEVGSLPLGLFGVGTGAAPALRLAASFGSNIRAVVAWEGRPDLAKKFLASVAAPTMLIVSEKDDLVRDLNRQAFDELRVEKELVMIPGATHLFEDYKALQAVGEQAAEWFARHLIRADARWGTEASVQTAA